MNPGVCPGLSTCWSCPGSLLPGVGPKLLLPMSKHSPVSRPGSDASTFGAFPDARLAVPLP